MRSPLLATAARGLAPLLLFFSIFLLLQGKDAPGGGFSAGLVAAAAFVLYGLATDAEGARRLLRFPPRAFITAGLLAAAAAALAGPLGGAPLFTARWTTLDTPAGSLALGTPLLFELAIYLVVVGATLAILLPVLGE